MLNKKLQTILAQFGLVRLQDGDFIYTSGEEEQTCWDGTFGTRIHCDLHDNIASNRWIKVAIELALDNIRNLTVQHPMSCWDNESNQEVEDSLKVLQDLLAL
jgi:hypothetical protein